MARKARLVAAALCAGPLVVVGLVLSPGVAWSANTPPAVTSANATTFTKGSYGAFLVTATGTPAPTLSESGALPAGVTFTPATGILNGTPTQSGVFPITFTAANGVGSPATQSFTLTVPIGLVLSQGAAFGILGYDCGGIQEQVYATGFDSSTGYPAGAAYLRTVCNGSGRGGRSIPHTAWASALWDFTGALISDAAISAPTVNPSLVATDSNGNEVFNASMKAYLLLAPGYVPKPRLLGMTPNFGPASGGTTVTLTGTGFTGASAPTFGGIAAASYNVVSDNTITAVTPISPAGTVHVAVTTAGGADVSSSIDQFTFYAQPTVTGLNPNTGPINGGTTVTITGTAFVGATTVWFGDTQAGFYVDNDTTITAFAPGEGNPDTVSVSVVTPGGTSTSTGGVNVFTYANTGGCGTSCGGGGGSTIQCAKLSGHLNGGLVLTRCAPLSKTDKKAVGSFSSGVLTWAPSGATTVVSLSAPVAVGQGGCAAGRTEYDLSGTVSGGTSTYTVFGDTLAARTCATKTGRLTLVPGTTFGL